MKKEQRCLFKRFAALVAALVVCASLCVPCFASNNASTFQWVVTAKQDKYGENGILTPYLQLSPYVDGKFYAATFETRFLSYRNSVFAGSNSEGSHYANYPQVWACPVNYPDWWRADLPLGRTAYVQYDKVNFISSGSSSSFSDLTSVSFLPQNKAYSFDVTAEYVVKGERYSGNNVHLSSYFPFYLIYTYSQATNNDVNSNMAGGDKLLLTGDAVSLGSSSPVVYSMSQNQFVLTLNQSNTHYSFYWIDSMANASLGQIEWLVIPNMSGWTDEQMLQLNEEVLKVSAEVSFWIDANKLPAGLEVGDSFPASDPFDSLRDELLDKYDVEKNIKDTDKYLNDSIYEFDSVDSAVSDSANSFLSPFFNSFLFIFSPVFIMLLGAGLLRIVLKKAVS